MTKLNAAVTQLLFRNGNNNKETMTVLGVPQGEYTYSYLFQVIKNSIKQKETLHS